MADMMKTGDHAVYGMNGICEIKAVEERDGAMFYRIVPDTDEGLTIFVPVTSVALRPPVSRSEADELLNNIPLRKR